MALELKQQLKLSQSLVMTPQLQLAIKLLQLSRLELVELVSEEIEINPVLDDTVEAGTNEGVRVEEEKQKPTEIDWQAYLEEQSDYGARRINFADRPDDEDFIGNLPDAHEGLGKHLLWQLSVSGLCEEEARLGEFIIGNISEDGYLRLLDRGSMAPVEYEAAVLDEIVRLTGVSPETATKVLGTVQQLDPVGVCARTVRECLLTQALLWPVRDTVVEEIISVHLEKLASRNYKGIARALGITFKEVCEAAATINKCLNPTPGAGFGIDSARTVIPDIFVNKVEDEYIVSLNDDGMPKLKLNKLYRNMLKANGTVSDTAKEYLQERLKSALWLIKSVHQRQRTIFKVMESIVSFQRDFLDFGLKHLKPLILKDVAEAIGVHESTVSRVTTNKYVQTPRGIFELKYFFSNAISNGEGTDVTAEYIRNKIKKIIESENSKKPYSDQQIVAELKESGVVLARRTATKYREALGFQSSSRRKVVY